MFFDWAGLLLSLTDFQHSASIILKHEQTKQRYR